MDHGFWRDRPAYAGTDAQGTWCADIQAERAFKERTAAFDQMYRERTLLAHCTAGFEQQAQSCRTGVMASARWPENKAQSIVIGCRDLQAA